jgi:hypothetical protein
MRGKVSFLSYTFRQLKIKPYRAVCLLKKLAGMTVDKVNNRKKFSLKLLKDVESRRKTRIPEKKEKY